MGRKRIVVTHLLVALDPETLDSIKIISRLKTRGNDTEALRLAACEYSKTLETDSKLFGQAATLKADQPERVERVTT
jgi:hypothetical protein